MVKIVNFKLIMTFAVPSNADDKNYERDLATTSFDLCKFSSGMGSYFFFQAFVKLFMEHFEAGYVFKCPVEKVIPRILYLIIYFYFNRFKAVVKIINCRISDMYIPRMAPEIKFKLKVKLVGTIPKNRKTLNFCDISITGENKNV